MGLEAAMTNSEIDAVIRTEPAAVYELRSSNATAASVRESLRLIARNIEREAYKRAAAECRMTCGKNHAGAAAFRSVTKAYVYACDDCADAIEALGREE